MNAPLWLQVATASAVTFALSMFAILFYMRHREQQTERVGAEIRVTPYIRRAMILTPAEQRFYVRLFQAVGSDVVICPKVRLADVIEVRGDALEWQAAWNRIAAKHLDFVLMSPDNYQPLLGIQLDDATPGGARREQWNDWLDRAVIAAGLPMLRIRVRSDYDSAALRREIEQKLSM